MSTTNRNDTAELNPAELRRYARHLVMPEITIEGQRRLKRARILCIGAGGLGSPAALYLAAAGVGTLGLVDFDTVDISNLQRQLLHGTSDVGRTKLESARDRLREVNPHTSLELHDHRFSSANAMGLVSGYDVVVDGSDNFPTRYLSNDVCVWAQKPNVYGSVFRFEGQSTVFAPHLGGPCYRCLFPEPPPAGAAPSCAEAGVLGVLPGIIGTLQAIEAIKLILTLGQSLVGRLLHFDALQLRFREFKIQRDRQCPVCGDVPTVTAPIDYDALCQAQPAPSTAAEMSVHELKTRIQSEAPILILDVREPFEYEIARIEPSTLMPLGDLPDRLDEIPRDKPLVVMCKSGVRSLQAADFLRRSGFGDVSNLNGGIDAWAGEIDPDMPRY